jgi:hypothetical protein
MHFKIKFALFLVLFIISQAFSFAVVSRACGAKTRRVLRHEDTEKCDLSRLVQLATEIF